MLPNEMTSGLTLFDSCDGIRGRRVATSDPVHDLRSIDVTAGPIRGVSVRQRDMRKTSGAQGIQTHSQRSGELSGDLELSEAGLEVPEHALQLWLASPAAGQAEIELTRVTEHGDVERLPLLRN